MINRVYHLFFRILQIIFVPVQVLDKNLDVEVVMYGGKKNVEMIVNAYNSFIFFTKMRLPLTVIDDGTMSKRDKFFLKSKFVNIHIYSANDLKHKNHMVKLLQGYLYCKKYRTARLSEKFNIKLFDPFLSARSNNIIYFDCDAIFLKKPKDLVLWINTNKKLSLFASEVAEQVSLTAEWGALDKMLAEKFKIKGNFNSGFICLRRKVYSLELIDKALEYFYKVGLAELWCTEQLSLSIIAQSNSYKDLNGDFIHLTKKGTAKMMLEKFNPSFIHFAHNSKVDYYAFALSQLVKHGFYSEKNDF